MQKSLVSDASNRAAHEADADIHQVDVSVRFKSDADFCNVDVGFRLETNAHFRHVHFGVRFKKGSYLHEFSKIFKSTFDLNRTQTSTKPRIK